MNYKFLLVSCLLWLCGSQQQTEAQCDRYRAAVFSDVQVDTSIVYNDLNGRLGGQLPGAAFQVLGKKRDGCLVVGAQLLGCRNQRFFAGGGGGQWVVAHFPG